MNKVTKTSRIIESLSQRLRGGEWRVEAPLPPVSVLSEEYAVSPGTVALALKSLERDGLVRVLPRQGVLAQAGAVSDNGSGHPRPTIGLYGSYAPSERKGYMGRLTDDILKAAHEVGGAVLMLPLLPEGEVLTAGYCRSRGVKGVIILGGRHADPIQSLRENGFPVITANRPLMAPVVNFCSYDHGHSVSDMLTRFLALGHRRIGVVSYISTTPGLMESFRPQMLQQLCDEGVVYNLNDYWRDIGSFSDSGVSDRVSEALESLFSLSEPPTALFCRRFVVPMVQAWLEHRGLEVPSDVSLIVEGLGEDESLCSGYGLRHDELARHLVTSLYAIIRNPFHVVQKLIPLPYVDCGTVAAAPSTVLVS